MNTRFPNSAIVRLCASLAVAAPLFAHGAVVPDRTRVIYDEGAQSESVTVANKSPKHPYLIQSWIEDSEGKKVASPFVVLPPLQRIEPNDRNVLRVAKLPGTTLPADRESVFYLNIREIPPKPEASSALQIALHSKLKLFYRPKSIKPERGVDTSLPMTIRVDTSSQKLIFENPTPYNITVVGLSTGSDENRKRVELEAIMVTPMSQADVPFKDAAPISLYVSHVNDFGGESEVKYACVADTCKSVQP
ncbi:molecular chaperone [Variovorax sp. YR216]|uniref:fimbrial biogenesis chaperone n=1 Tax=Variovorax sp. YR216 TaxID=1882828 RepID=UPI000894EFD0|nr:molecular chaperone [Variovorax sp. YR216]SEA03329.1 fimbrial chaperone protein [Variovorax sp. YR216]